MANRLDQVGARRSHGFDRTRVDMFDLFGEQLCQGCHGMDGQCDHACKTSQTYPGNNDDAPYNGVDSAHCVKNAAHDVIRAVPPGRRDMILCAAKKLTGMAMIVEKMVAIRPMAIVWINVPAKN